MELVRLNEVTEELRRQIWEALLAGFKGYEIRQLLNVTEGVITRERKYLKLGKWSPNSPSAVKAKDSDVAVLTGNSRWAHHYACDKCGRPTVIKMGRYGQFVACTGYPDCSYTKPYIRSKSHNVASTQESKVTQKVYLTPIAPAPPKPSNGVVSISIDEIPLRDANKHVVTEWASIRALKPNEAIKFPCRWKHNSTVYHQVCNSFGNIGKIFNKNKWEGTWNCKDGFVYVGRYEGGK